MNAFIGSVIAWPSPRLPSGWAWCQGQLLQVQQHQPLFSLIGNAYGGDGRTTFALPDITPLVSGGKQLKWIIALEGEYPDIG